MTVSRFRFRLLAVLLACSLIVPLFTFKTSAAASPLDSSASWLAGQQQANGGFKGLTGKTDPGTTADAVVALVAAGGSPGAERFDKSSALAYLAGQAPGYATTESGAIKLLLAAVAAGSNPRRFGGIDLVSAVQRGYDIKSGMFDKQLFIHADAVLALTASGITVPQPAISALLKAQGSDGGWAFTGSTQAGQADSNTTALVLQTLVATHAATPKIIDGALAYLRTTQTRDGGFAYQPPAPGSPFASDANSTANVIQAIIAAGQDPNSAGWHQAGAALVAFQNKDGAFRYQQSAPADNLLASLQAIPALASKALPVRPAAELSEAVLLQAALTPAKPSAGCRYFAPTQHNVCGSFLNYWSKFGGLAIYGYPISETFTEHGLTVQYFQRARFELHLGLVPQRDQVLLGLLGDVLSKPAQSAHPQAFAKLATPAIDSCSYFGKTGHDICGPFEAYWTAHGGLLTFGYPISQPFTQDGHTIQYFERTRFEIGAAGGTSDSVMTLPLVGSESLSEH